MIYVLLFQDRKEQLRQKLEGFVTHNCDGKKHLNYVLGGHIVCKNFFRVRVEDVYDIYCS